MKKIMKKIFLFVFVLFFLSCGEEEQQLPGEVVLSCRGVDYIYSDGVYFIISGGEVVSSSEDCDISLFKRLTGYSGENNCKKKPNYYNLK